MLSQIWERVKSGTEPYGRRVAYTDSRRIRGGFAGIRRGFAQIHAAHQDFPACIISWYMDSAMLLWSHDISKLGTSFSRS